MNTIINTDRKRLLFLTANARYAYGALVMLWLVSPSFLGCNKQKRVPSPSLHLVSRTNQMTALSAIVERIPSLKITNIVHSLRYSAIADYDRNAERILSSATQYELIDLCIHAPKNGSYGDEPIWLLGYGAMSSNLKMHAELLRSKNIPCLLSVHGSVGYAYVPKSNFVVARRLLRQWNKNTNEYHLWYLLTNR